MISLDARFVTSLPVFSGLALLLASPGSIDEAAFSPRSHLILTKTYTEATSLEVDSFEITMNGEPMQQEVPEASVEARRRIVFADEYASVEEGKILILERAFEELEGTTAVALLEGDEEHQARHASEFEGALVRFEWDADEEAYVRSFEEGGSGDDEHLAALDLDTDLTGFLPEGGVASGDTWTVDASALNGVFAPSGDLRLLGEDLGDAAYTFLDKEAMFAAMQTSLGEISDAWEGEIEATYVGSAEEDGMNVGTIELAIDVTVEADLLGGLKRTIEHLGSGDADVFQALDMDWTLSGTGVLKWDLDAGHARGFTLDAEVEMEARLAYVEPFFDERYDIEATYLVSGSTSVEMSVDG